MTTHFLICIPRHGNSAHGAHKPAWMEALYTHNFFAPCDVHESAKKNEKNVCCLDCCASICPHCVSAHRLHRLLQVRRYVYHDVVRLEDLEKLIDCSNVQAYTINSSKVIFIKKRPQNRQFKGCGNYCTSCDRSLQEPYIHCSLGCKVEYLVKCYKDLSPYLRQCNTLELGPDFFVPQETGDEDINAARSGLDYEEASDRLSENTSNIQHQQQVVMYTANFITRKKRSNSNNNAILYLCGRPSAWKASTPSDDHQVDINTTNNFISRRRKRNPHRSPLC
ncbi:protein RGF1 INDUCIBLE TRANSCRIPTION FACTOR 1-like [Impatiens glandulifera]|uniref:protein RGF1 INDUCIBLE TRANSCRIPTION FACTOR 1-like n=1 Tax=Impatiens glandulifera TaxID=253017 RepID=UPI001FB19931|nr:protein RGF1 INDUCIBLE TRANSCRIPTION FACTOR 1-like [Impatiens glandulifera]